MATSNPASDALPKATEKPAVTASGDSTNVMQTILPYAVAILAQLPLFILYWMWLWHRPHYFGWFPFALAATAALAWARWPRGGRQVFMDSQWSNFLLIAGLGAGLAGTVFVEPWFAALSIFTLVASLLARTIDMETGRSLWVVSLPMFVSLALPADYDFVLITFLQSTSAGLTSLLLDLVNIAHYMPGTVILTANAEYGVEEACSGIQSFFLLVFVSVAFCVWMRRPLFRSLLLFAAAIVWSVFMNCMRIFLIPVCDVYMDLNLVDGVQHDLLGWATMALGIMLLLSTDQFLMFLFGPVDPNTGAAGPLGPFVTRIWNNIISGDTDNEESKSRRRGRRKPLSSLSRSISWGVAGVMVLGGMLALWDIKNSYASGTSKTTVNFFSGEVVYPLVDEAMPDKIKSWKKLSYNPSVRKRASDLGQNTDAWIYRSEISPLALTISFDQTFPGWHELTRCYRNQGWIVDERQRQPWEESQADENGKKKSWNFVEVRMSKETGEQGILLFSLFDGFGEAFDPPEKYGTLAHIMNGAKNRLGERARARLFQSEGYQVQVFVSGFGDLGRFKDEMTDHYLEVREIVRREFLAAKSRDGAAAE